jgi:hypothetical protein
MITFAKKVWCDYRECDAEYFEERIGKRGQEPSNYMPIRPEWVRTEFRGGGMGSETLHFCCTDHMQKEVNLLTMQGIDAPKVEAQRSLEARTS